MKNFTITETGKAEIISTTTCPICGACYDGDTTTWDFVSNCWSKAPLTCGHGVALTENTNNTDDASLDNWQDSVLIFAEFIPELEALGYKEEVEEEAPDPLNSALDRIAQNDNIHPAFRDGLKEEK